MSPSNSSVYVGTSGYNYPEWRGRFYPERCPSARMLELYAQRFRTVEINATFYRMPTPKVVEGWASQVPPDFRFSLKAPRRITHDQRLANCEDAVRMFCDTAGLLGERLGRLLFQLPPNFKADEARLRVFLGMLPPGAPIAFEFRHPSWWTDAIYDCLRARSAALCLADTGTEHPPMVSTADVGYLRLRDEGYQDADLTAWASRVTDQADWREAFVYFKHEDEAKGPDFAMRFMERLPQ